MMDIQNRSMPEMGLGSARSKGSIDMKGAMVCFTIRNKKKLTRAEVKPRLELRVYNHLWGWAGASGVRSRRRGGATMGATG